MEKYRFHLAFLVGMVISFLIMPLAIDGVLWHNEYRDYAYSWDAILVVAMYICGVFAAYKTIPAFRYEKRERILGISSLSYIWIASLIMVGYSLITRNIFEVSAGLFTIVGFDMALAAYLLGFENRKRKANILLFVILFILFLYSGFRYRIVLLLIPLVLFFGGGVKKRLYLKLMLVFLMTALLMAYGGIRKYGEFVSLENLEFGSILDLVRTSGELTATVATLSVVMNIEKISLIGMQPITILSEHFIPSFIIGVKDRSEVLGIYLKVTDDLNGTSAALHDVAQSVVMFGKGLIFFSTYILWVLFFFLTKSLFLDEKRKYFAIAVLCLVAFFIPSRGYSPQQITWILSFLIPWVLVSKITLKKRFYN